MSKDYSLTLAEQRELDAARKWIADIAAGNRPSSEINVAQDAERRVWDKIRARLREVQTKTTDA